MGFGVIVACTGAIAAAVGWCAFLSFVAGAVTVIGAAAVMSSTILGGLGSKDPLALNNRPCVELSKLAHDARLPESQIKEIARKAKAAGSDEGAMEVLGNEREGLEDHIRTIQIEGASVPPASRQLRQHLGYVLKFDGREHELIETNPVVGPAHLEVLEKSIRILSTTLRGQR